MTEAEIMEMRLRYAGAIWLLCECSVHLANHGVETDELRDSIERACLDWAAQTKWGVRRLLDRIEVVPPAPTRR